MELMEHIAVNNQEQVEIGQNRSKQVKLGQNASSNPILARVALNRLFAVKRMDQNASE